MFAWVIILYFIEDRKRIFEYAALVQFIACFGIK